MARFITILLMLLIAVFVPYFFNMIELIMVLLNSAMPSSCTSSSWPFLAPAESPDRCGTLIQAAIESLEELVPIASSSSRSNQLPSSPSSMDPYEVMQLVFTRVQAQDPDSGKWLQYHGLLVAGLKQVGNGSIGSELRCAASIQSQDQTLILMLNVGNMAYSFYNTSRLPSALWMLGSSKSRTQGALS
ncbi:hypothetical protein SELMODRAFT_425171 [Selaginella moellendorffii]|uniref:Uncharacterized protein n=1 Tax=Selaginella moellendorffii TaxID=88036 RepID=D8SS85_SELML|nr:hypothetical protein SELMODRAFT_425171 [Selaginella moellendorffii]